MTRLYRYGRRKAPYVRMRVSSVEDNTVDIVGPYHRFRGKTDLSDLIVRDESERSLEVLPSPSELLLRVPKEGGWSGLSKLSRLGLYSWFLVAEDEQRRLDARPVVALAHQASLVQHILKNPDLRRVLIADEVGLGKTIEAALLIQALLEEDSNRRVLYLAPARLVANVRREFERLQLGFRCWSAGEDSNGSFDDPRLIASIHRAVHVRYKSKLLCADPWDVIVVDECHHLSAWAEGGGMPTLKYQLIDEIRRKKLRADGRLILMSGTPHQGSRVRFENLLSLMAPLDGKEKKKNEGARGQVIYRTKDDVSDWNRKPLFPSREIRKPTLYHMGEDYRHWLRMIHEYFSKKGAALNDPKARASGWRCGLALQWATSSVKAGLGFLVRQAARAGWTLDRASLVSALKMLRPYRNGADDEDITLVWDRILREVKEPEVLGDIEDAEDIDFPSGESEELDRIIQRGVEVSIAVGNEKWDFLWERILADAGEEKIVLFAQPIETVTSLAAYLKERSGRDCSIIVGGQTDEERQTQVQQFWSPGGPRFLVSSRAGGEGLNLQVARRLVHVDVPWNPMELEQRIGRVHRFLSRRKIIVDTLIVADSREVHTYDVARNKLREIASAMVDEDEFERVFSRVMTLVPPEQLQLVLAGAPSGLNDEDTQRIRQLVADGYRDWEYFHRTFSDNQKIIQALSPGNATWEDLLCFVRESVGAEEVSGFTAQTFGWADGEIVGNTESASVYRLWEDFYTIGDYLGIPVVGPDGRVAKNLGLNHPQIIELLNTYAHPEEIAGAAHFKWTERSPEVVAGEHAWGIVVAVRRTLSQKAAVVQELSPRLHMRIVSRNSDYAIEGATMAQIIRSLWRATPRRSPPLDDELIRQLGAVERRLIGELQVRSDQEVQQKLMPVVVPIFAAIIAT